MIHRTSIPPLSLGLFALVLLVSACASPSPTSQPPSPTLPPQNTASPTPSPTATPPPSPTPVPLAALVNDEPITLAEYQAELARFRVARQELPDVPPAPGINLATEADMQAFVLNELIGQRLFAQAAYANGFSLSQDALQASQDKLKDQLGSDQALQAWLTANQYDLAAFQAALARSIATAWMRDQVMASFPTNAEQVHARQILLYNLDQANQILAQIRSGQDFTALAFQYDPKAGGDLGWFPRGYLFEPALEEAAFKLEPNAYSEVITTRLGYHLLLVIAHETDRPLDPDVRLALQQQALSTWLQEQKAKANIQIFVP